MEDYIPSSLLYCHIHSTILNQFCVYHFLQWELLSSFPLGINDAKRFKILPVDHYHNLNNTLFDQHIQLIKISHSIWLSSKTSVYSTIVSILTSHHLIQMRIHLHLTMQHKVDYYLPIIVVMKHNYYSIHISKYISMILPK